MKNSNQLSITFTLTHYFVATTHNWAHHSYSNVVTTNQSFMSDDVFLKKAYYIIVSPKKKNYRVGPWATFGVKNFNVFVTIRIWQH